MMKLIVYFIISHLLYTIECGRTNLNDGNSEADVVQIISTSTGDEFVKPDYPPKYFAIDLDGTFYTDNEEAMNKNLKALQALIKLGYTPFFCTGMLNNDINTRVHPGRTYDSSLYLFKNLEKETGYNGYPGIYVNGYVVFGKDGIVLHSNVFTADVLRLFYDYVKEKGLLSSTIFYSLSASLKCVDLVDELEKICEEDNYPKPGLISYEDLLKESIITVTIYSNEDLTNIDIPGLKNGEDFIVKPYPNAIYDYLPPGGSKLQGLKILMEYFGEDPSSCGFIGDGENDIEIMNLSNLSFAVNNADDFVKGEAKYYVNLTNDEAAVAHIFQQVYGITL